MTRVADITIFGRLAALATCLLACGSIDEHLADLDSPDPGVRQSAAYRLLLKGKAAAPALIAVVDSGSGYNSQNVAPVHFGLPGAGLVDVEVVFPAGGRRDAVRETGVDPASTVGRPVTIRTGR